MAGYAAPGFDTLALHAGSAPDPVTGARTVPLHLSTSFVFESAEHAASLFNLERPGHVYSRLSNPTTAVLEERIAALEGGVGARCHLSQGSGQGLLGGLLQQGAVQRAGGFLALLQDVAHALVGSGQGGRFG